MEYTPVTLQELLQAREHRWSIQCELLNRHKLPLISFTMNIAGPLKNSDLIHRGFLYGDALLREELLTSGFRLAEAQLFHENTGNEGFYLVDAPAEDLKRLTMSLEDSLPLGRLFDMDVLTPEKVQLSRKKLGFPLRRCLICGQDAKICARSGIHTPEELQKATVKILKDALNDKDASEIARLAVQSLLFEVCTSPKPGLVDRINSGSHKDMDIFTFMASSSALWPYFYDAAMTGLLTAQESPKETFRRLRIRGRRAEGEMRRATGGVNTHKGAIFSLGILCGALGRLFPSLRSMPEVVLAECSAMTDGLLEEEYRTLTKETARSMGEKLYLSYGIRGVRGQAEDGFPAVQMQGLPVLREGLKQGLSLERAGGGTLLALLSSAIDTNMIKRSSKEREAEVRSSLASFLQDTPYPDEAALLSMDEDFRKENLSPGGSADLLAITYFLHFLEDKQYGLLDF